MHVQPLHSREEFERYARFAHEVYRGNPYWAPDDESHVIGQISNQSAFAPNCEAQAFAAVEGDRILATVTALVNNLYNRHWRENAGHLCYFEALPDCDAAVKALVDEACEWLRNKNCEFARHGFLYGWQIPLTIDAYDAVPTLFHTYNPPCYHAYIKNAGFRTERGLVEYRVRFDNELVNRYRDFSQAPRVTLRNWDLSRLEQESEVFLALYNETFAEHWGAPQFSLEEIMGLTVGMKDVLVPQFLWFAEADGETVGFVYAVPDLNQPIHRPGEIDHGVLLAIGVRRSHRGRGVNLALAARSYLAMIERGYQSASYTIVLDDNWPSRRTAEKLGARVARSFNVYRRDLA